MKEKFKATIGAFVWAKLTGYPLWPAKITRIKDGKVCVLFFGSESEKFAWVKEPNLRPFDEQSAQEAIDDIKPSEKYASELKQAIQEAVQLYQSEIASNLNEDVCYLCKQGGFLILCDGCPNAVHIQCAGLSAIPEGSWFCKDCDAREKALEKQSKSKTAKAVQESMQDVNEIFSKIAENVEEAPRVATRKRSSMMTKLASGRLGNPVSKIASRGYWKMLSGTNAQQFDLLRQKLDIQPIKRKRTATEAQLDHSSSFIPLSNKYQRPWNEIPKLADTDDDKLDASIPIENSDQELFIRYRYQTEKLDEFKTVQLSLSRVDSIRAALNNNILSGTMIHKLMSIVDENSTKKELRYIDEKEDGWILIKPTTDHIPVRNNTLTILVIDHAKLYCAA